MQAHLPTMQKSPGTLGWRPKASIALLLTCTALSALDARASGEPVRATQKQDPTPSAERAQPINPYEALDRIGQGLAVVEQSYFEAPDRDEIVTGALRGLVAELDPHSTYLSPEALKLFEEDTTGSFGGIGIEVDLERDEAIVIAPVEGSPADRAGIVPGDSIVRLFGVPLGERKPEEVILAMRGPIGSRIWLTIRKKSGEFRELELTREAIRVQSVRAAELVGNLLYLRIKSFQDGTHSELTDRIAEYRKQHGQESGILLDMRNNPGGLVREATGVADEFLSSGLIFETRHRGAIEKRYSAHKGGAATTVPVLILVNEYSASAAELVAAALKDNGRAKVVGARTFGKGSVQTVLALSENSAVKLTTALYYSPSGRTLQALGVEPDYPVDPGYKKGAPILTERDLEGHIVAGHDAEPELDRAQEKPTSPSGVPPTNDAVHHGVLRTVAGDPRNGPDRALSFAVTLLLGPGDAPPTAAPVP
jgi:carboxyl-terminal processing protease